MLVCWRVEISQATNSDCVVCLQSLVASLNQPKKILKDLFSETIQRSKTPRHWLLHAAFEETRRFSKYHVSKLHNTNKYLENILKYIQRYNVPKDSKCIQIIFLRMVNSVLQLLQGCQLYVGWFHPGEIPLHQIPFGSYQIQQMERIENIGFHLALEYQATTVPLNILAIIPVRMLVTNSIYYIKLQFATAKPL